MKSPKYILLKIWKRARSVFSGTGQSTPRVSPRPKPQANPKFISKIGPRDTLITDKGVSLTGRISVDTGEGNSFEFGKNTRFDGTISLRGSGNRVVFGRNCHFRGRIIMKGRNQTVCIGDETTTVGVYILCQENRDVHIGGHCMFSRGIEIRTTDAHSVIDRTTGKRLNPPGNVVIGDHVWVGLNALIGKGSNIPHDSIVGANSFVNRGFDEEGILLAGSPARVMRRGITWNRNRRAKFAEEELDAWKIRPEVP